MASMNVMNDTHLWVQKWKEFKPWKCVPCYRPQMKFAKVMFLHLSVSHSVHRGGVSQHAMGQMPPTPRKKLGRLPPSLQEETRKTPPSSRKKPGRLPPSSPPPRKKPGRLPPSSPPPRKKSGRPSWKTDPPPPSSACWEIRATSGRYASYWNAYL